jgi:hypothetical protein
VEVEAQDTLARILAIAGLAVGLLGTIIALLSFLRDGYRLTVDGVKAYSELDGSTWYEVAVANHGRQPVTVVGAGLLYQHPSIPRRDSLMSRFRRGPPREAGMIFVSFIGEPVLFPPGAAKTFTPAASAKSLLFGNIRLGYAVRRVRAGPSGINLARLEELHSDSGQVGYRLAARVDGKPTLGAAVIIGAHSAT